MRDVDLGVIYKEDIIEAEGIDGSSAEVDKNQECTLGYLCI